MNQNVQRRRASVKSADELLQALATGPVLSFGSSREVNDWLQELRAAGRIQYRKVKDGGAGWELTP